MVELTDTHCHIQSAGLKAGSANANQALWAKLDGLSGLQLIQRAAKVGVNRLVCVGCDLADSQLAIKFVADQPNCWASIGIHPHEAKDYVDSPDKLAQFAALATQPKVIAIGETGLDYFYNHSPRAEQIRLLRIQLELAQKHDLPLIFHVREAFDDFWPIFDEFQGLRGVIHSFTAKQPQLEQILERDLYVGLNGITTFAKDPEQIAAFKAVPLSQLLLETDAPFLTPVPFRGKICEPQYISVTAQFLSETRGETLEQLAMATTQNAQALFRMTNEATD
ncbi:MAG: TatD family hydrolase [Candidatus Saccharimonadales bacterium]